MGRRGAAPRRFQLDQPILLRLISKEGQALAKNFLPCGGNRTPDREGGGDLRGHGDEAFHCHATLEADRRERGEHLVPGDRVGAGRSTITCGEMDVFQVLASPQNAYSLMPFSSMFM